MKNQYAVSSASARVRSLLLFLFIGSGCSALIYEIVWFQLLQLVIGASAVSLGVLLGTFMGGMCLGSLALPRIVARTNHPLRVYALIEIGTGVIAIAVLFAMPYVGGLYTAYGGHGFSGILLRAAVCAALLLPPTVLMGATLPAVARFIEISPQGVSWLGMLYSGNIAGGVSGCLLAGFYLLRVYDMATATYVAAAINAGAAAFALAIAARVPHAAAAVAPAQDRAAPAANAWIVYVVIALSGLTALGAEVVWTRLLSLLLGATVYTFAIILAVFLLGLGIGSSAGSRFLRTCKDARAALGWCQMLLAAAIAWAAAAIGYSLPYWPIDPRLATSPWVIFQVDLVRCLLALLPAACLWGASFPLALAAAASRGEDAGRMVAAVYAANTVGAIIGALAFSMVAIPIVGTQHAQQLLIGLTALAGLLALVPRLPPSSVDRLAGEPARRPALLARAAAMVLSVVLAGLLALIAPGAPREIFAYGRNIATDAAEGVQYLFVGEGINASVAVTETEDGIRSFHVSGQPEASTDSQVMRELRMLGHIPALLHRKPTSVLIVGFGAGITAGSFVLYPEIERIVICEIEPLIPQVVSKYFKAENYDVLNDPRVQVVYDDARHFMLTTKEKFDIITSDPIHPRVKGAATLYTREYFELARQHLNPRGVIAQWVPLYESDLEVVKSELATFFSVFPAGIVWSNHMDGNGDEVVMFGQADPGPIDLDVLLARLNRPDYAKVTASLAQVGFKTAVDLLSTYLTRGRDLAPWLAGAPVNIDRDLRLQYLAGITRELADSDEVYTEMLIYRFEPDDLYIGSEETRQALSEAFAEWRASRRTQ